MGQGVLADLFSYGDAARRNLVDALRNPTQWTDMMASRASHSWFPQDSETQDEKNRKLLSMALALGPMQTVRPSISPEVSYGRLISSQKHLDEDIVARKMKEKDFKVSVSPPFTVDGETLSVINDGHHALEAANRAGVKPRIFVQSHRENDRIGLLNSGKIDDFLESSYVDSPWYYKDTGVTIW